MLKNSTLTILHHLAFKANQKGETTNKGASWAQCNQKVVIWNVIFLFYVQQQAISQLDCDSGWKVDFMIAGEDQLTGLYWEEAPKHSWKPNFCTPKWSWSLVVGHDPLQLSEFGKASHLEKYAQQINGDELKLQQKGPNSSLGQWPTDVE